MASHHRHIVLAALEMSLRLLRLFFLKKILTHPPGLPASPLQVAFFLFLVLLETNVHGSVRVFSGGVPPVLLDATIPSLPARYPRARACPRFHSHVSVRCVCGIGSFDPLTLKLLIASETAQEVDSLEELVQFRQEGGMPRVLMALSPTPYTTKVSYTYRCLGSFPGSVSGSTF